ncbi:hypothetical protein C3L33_21402, partial [Rhododendron williamsianum]
MQTVERRDGDRQTTGRNGNCRHETVNIHSSDVVSVNKLSSGDTDTYLEFCCTLGCFKDNMSGMDDVKEHEHVGDVSEDSEKAMPSAQQEEAAVKSKYGGIMPKKPPLISKDHERAYFDSADWALGKQGVEKPKGPLEKLRPKLQGGTVLELHMSCTAKAIEIGERKTNVMQTNMLDLNARRNPGALCIAIDTGVTMIAITYNCSSIPTLSYIRGDEGDGGIRTAHRMSVAMLANIPPDATNLARLVETESQYMILTKEKKSSASAIVILYKVENTEMPR